MFQPTNHSANQPININQPIKHVPLVAAVWFEHAPCHPCACHGFAAPPSTKLQPFGQHRRSDFPSWPGRSQIQLGDKPRALDGCPI